MSEYNDVWKYFKRSEDKAQCILCQKILRCKESSTTGLHRHLFGLHAMKRTADYKDRPKNPKGGYNRHLKSAVTPSDFAAKAKKPYHLAEYVTFLQPFTKSHRTKSYIPSEYPADLSLEITEDDDTAQECVADAKTEKQDHHEQDIHQQSPSEAACSNQNFTTNVSNTYKKRSKSPLFVVDVNKSEYEHFQSKKISVENKMEDPDLSFLKSILPDMKEMNNDQKRQFKIDILNLAGQILNENCASPAHSTHSSSSSMPLY